MITYPEEGTYSKCDWKTLLIWFQLSLAFTCGESINTSNILRLKSALVFSTYCKSKRRQLLRLRRWFGLMRVLLSLTVSKLTFAQRILSFQNYSFRLDCVDKSPKRSYWWFGNQYLFHRKYKSFPFRSFKKKVMPSINNERQQFIRKHLQLARCGKRRKSDSFVLASEWLKEWREISRQQSMVIMQNQRKTQN